jgi:hypothetical protein
MKVYISGKITGLDIKVAEGYFEVIEQELSKAGHQPINPCKILPFHPDHTWQTYMIEDFKALLSCDAILMLENWTDSKGARIEHAIAKELGLNIYYQKNHQLF